jgi:hypothetical protein
MAEVRKILARVWTRIVEFDVERSFTCDNARLIEPGAVVLGRGWSLFTFDFIRQCGVFLRCPDDAALVQAPFVYNAQFEQATDVAIVSFDELLLIADELPDISNLVQFFSIGHCGSTLLHHVFNRVPGVVCISEPIAFNALALNGGGVDNSLNLRLARAALRLLACVPGAETAECIVVKHFSQSTTQLKLLSAAQPQSKNLFLYRDALGWANSCYHFVQKYGVALEVSKEQRSLLWRILSGGLPESVLIGILDLHAETLTFDALSAVAWACHMQHYFKARGAGVALHTLRYNELLSNRHAVLNELFTHLCLPVREVEATLGVFERDAHEGTRSARTTTDLHFTAENYAVVTSILAHPKLRMPGDIILERA